MMLTADIAFAVGYLPAPPPPPTGPEPVVALPVLLVPELPFPIPVPFVAPEEVVPVLEAM
jgi:hypothetical protein